MAPDPFENMDFPRIEPSAELRQAGLGLREMYLALLQGGFPTQEALYIIGVALASGTKPPE